MTKGEKMSDPLARISTPEELDQLTAKATIVDSAGDVWTNNGDGFNQWACVTNRASFEDVEWRSSKGITLPAIVVWGQRGDARRNEEPGMNGPSTYKSKSAAIEAMLLNGNARYVMTWVQQIPRGKTITYNFNDDDVLYVANPHGGMKAEQGDYVIRDADGHFYACKPDFFLANYEPVL